MTSSVIPRWGALRGIGAWLGALGLVIGGLCPVLAQTESRDQALVERVRAAYRDVHSLRARFTQVNDWELLESGVYRGTLSVRTDGRLRIEYQEPPGHLMVADGTWLWTYIPESGQALRAPAGQSGELITRLFVDFLAGRRVVAVTWKDDGAELVLEPEERVALRRLVVGVDPRTGLGKTFAWTDLEGNTARYEFVESEVNTELDGALFEFTPPPGVEVVELDSEERW